MVDPRQEAVLAHLQRSQEAIERVSADGRFVAAITAIADQIAASLKAGGKVLLAGNGGSAAVAQHIAAELVGRPVGDRAPLAVIALTADTSVLTAVGNTRGFEQVFAHQLRAIGRRGDVLIALSTSGHSGNVIAGLDAARQLGIVTIGFTKHAQTPMNALCDFLLAVPVKEHALIQQIHVTAGHAICRLVEQELSGESRS